MSNIDNLSTSPIKKKTENRFNIHTSRLSAQKKNLGENISEDEYIKYIIGIIKTFIKDHSEVKLDKLGKYIKNENIYNYHIVYHLPKNDNNRSTGERNVNNFIKKKFGSLKKLYEMIKDDRSIKDVGI